MDQPNVVADELRAWRARRELTQSAAAQALGISLRTYQHWESRDSRGPDHPSVVRLAIRALDYFAATVERLSAPPLGG